MAEDREVLLDLSGDLGGLETDGEEFRVKEAAFAVGERVSRGKGELRQVGKRPIDPFQRGVESLGEAAKG